MTALRFDLWRFPVMETNDSVPLPLFCAPSYIFHEQLVIVRRPFPRGLYPADHEATAICAAFVAAFCYSNAPVSRWKYYHKMKLIDLIDLVFVV